MSALATALKPIRDRMQMMVGRAILSAVDDSKTLQSLQIELTADEAQDGVEHFQPYGFAAHPKPGAEAIALAVGGLRSHALVIGVADRRYRMKAMQEGEVAIYDDLGQFVLIGRAGIRIVSPLGVSIETEGNFSVAADGDVSIVAQGEMMVDGADILLGDGASLDAARKTDAVAGGVITGGSSKVKIA